MGRILPAGLPDPGVSRWQRAAIVATALERYGSVQRHSLPDESGDVGDDARLFPAHALVGAPGFHFYISTGGIGGERLPRGRDRPVGPLVRRAGGARFLSLFQWMAGVRLCLRRPTGRAIFVAALRRARKEGLLMTRRVVIVSL